ncbi:Uncharacterised protein [Eubacterium limosum]|uniref:Uncharacterized protein n=1 Tax=Eubacterium limosum TaxID=1736 RepID=A0A6N3BQA3_EUBLI
MNPKMQSILTPKSFKKQIEAHPDQFEKVENTGYEDREGREVMAQYVFHGQALTQTCKGCGGVLKPKEMRAEGQNGHTHIVNGLAKPVEVAPGQVVVVYVCSRVCLECATHQRIFPEGVAGWVRHALMMVWELLTLLFENDELSHPGKMKEKVRRPWERLDFYGENATLYRWRARAAQWFSREQKKNNLIYDH